MINDLKKEWGVSLLERFKRLSKYWLLIILPQLILQCIPSYIVVKELEVPDYRNIGMVLRDKKSTSLAVKRFIDYIKYK